MSVLRLSPTPSPTRPSFLDNDTDNDGSDFDQASISLSSPRHSVQSTQHDPFALEPVSLNDFQEKHAPIASSTNLETPKASDATALADTVLKDVNLNEAPTQLHEAHAIANDVN